MLGKAVKFTPFLMVCSLAFTLSAGATLAETESSLQTLTADQPMSSSMPMQAFGPAMQIPYEICMRYCRLAEEPFRDCHNICKELVPLPGDKGACE